MRTAPLRLALAAALTAGLGLSAFWLAAGSDASGDGPGDGYPMTRPPGPAVPSAVQSASFERVLDLRGPWQLRLGDDPTWAEPVGAGSADDLTWETVFVPAPWEDEGLWGYDGFAWYRRTFTLPDRAAALAAGRPLVVRFGQIDDVDEVYLNGQRIGGTGAMPPDYSTAYFDERAYFLPAEALRTRGRNTLAVRVYDGELSGGIVRGPVEIGVAAIGTVPGTALVADLAGRWRFAPGDNRVRALPGIDDSGWQEVTVPERWESQGAPDLNGFAWLRRSFELSAGDAARPLVFVAGAIDDLDEVFVNGVRVGGTGLLGPAAGSRPPISGDEWQTPRAYAVPAGLLRAGRNTVAVRVYDALVDGGIVAGPVGLATPDAARGLVRALGGDRGDSR